MSETMTVMGTGFILPRHKDDGDEPFSTAVSRIEELIDDTMDGYPIDLEAHDDGEFALWMDTHDVGDSFRELVNDLTTSIVNEGLVLSPCRVVVRSDTMEDERDGVIYMGPNQVAMDWLEEEDKIKAIAEILNVPRDAPEIEAVARLAHRKTPEEYAKLLDVHQILQKHAAMAAEGHPAQGEGADGSSEWQGLNEARQAWTLIAIRDCGHVLDAALSAPAEAAQAAAVIERQRERG
jgi:hypothetical protein